VACSGGGSDPVGISSVFSNGIHFRITKQKAKLGSDKMVGRELQTARQTEFPTHFFGVLQIRLNSEIQSGKPADYPYWTEQAQKRAHSSRMLGLAYDRNPSAVLYPSSVIRRRTWKP
jgi:hypothetical protein